MGTLLLEITVFAQNTWTPLSVTLITWVQLFKTNNIVS